MAIAARIEVVVFVCHLNFLTPPRFHIVACLGFEDGCCKIVCVLVDDVIIGCDLCGGNDVRITESPHGDHNMMMMMMMMMMLICRAWFNGSAWDAQDQVAVSVLWSCVLSCVEGHGIDEMPRCVPCSGVNTVCQYINMFVF